MSLVGLLIFMGIAPAPQSGLPAELGAAVATYWDYLQKGDKNAALRFVLQEARNAFIKRREPVIKAWKVDAVSPSGEGKYNVTVSVKTLSESGFRELSVTEPWVLKEGSWSVDVPNYSQALRRLWPTAPARPKAGALEVLPTTMAIHFISPTQRGKILIRNGLDRPVRVLGLAYDAKLFEIDEKVEVVPPGESRHLVLRYTGGETRKNLTSRLELTLQNDEKVTSYTIPVTYNLVSAGTRALFGLTTEEAERLERDDSLSPVIKPPFESSHADLIPSGKNPKKRQENKEL